jgi:hypothetical protein
MGHEVARTVRLRPEAIGHPAAQLTGQDDRSPPAVRDGPGRWGRGPGEATA